jgi:hypothetical protein
MWLFETPKNYTEMCKKISTSVFWFVLIELFILSQVSKEFSELMKIISFNTEVEISSLKLYISYIYIPIIFSIVENVFKMHDLFGRIFKIRRLFFGTVIFSEYIKQLKIEVKLSRLGLLKKYLKDEDLQLNLRKHFYHHVSDEKTLIDNHYVYMALGSWCWVWIILDNFVFSILLIIFTAIFGFHTKSLIIGLSVFCLFELCVVIVLLFTYCKKYSQKEVKCAVEYDSNNNSDKLNKELKKEIINALCNK